MIWDFASLPSSEMNPVTVCLRLAPFMFSDCCVSWLLPDPDRTMRCRSRGRGRALKLA